MLYGVKELAKALGLSERQVNIRLDLISTHLNGYVRRGSRLKRLLDSSGFSVLQHIVSLEKERGLSCRDAVQVVRGELGNADKDVVKEDVEVRSDRAKEMSRLGEGNVGESLLIRELRARIADKDAVIADKDAQIGRLTEEIVFLRNRVEELLPLALPSPKPRRRWFTWLFRSSMK